MAEIDGLDLRERVGEILNHWPTAGLAGRGGTRR
jgi:hypothetical protein